MTLLFAPAMAAEPARCLRAPVAGVEEIVTVARPMCGVTDARRVEARAGTTLVEDTRGTVRRYGGPGWMDTGRVVDERLSDASAPSPVPDAVQADVGPAGGCAVTRLGGLVCWGEPWGGAPEPRAAAGVADAAEVKLATPRDGCYRTTGGELSCWGPLAGGTLDAPARVVGATEVVAFDVGPRHGCVVRRDGGVACFGENPVGQLGDGTRDGHRDARPVHGIADAVGVSVAEDHTCVVLRSGGVACFGLDLYGELGAPRRARDGR
ncbi:MAG: RCC1 domain-containing protein [Myxococcota bacterium]